MTRIIIASPTCGKTHLLGILHKLRFSVMDTDWFIFSNANHKLKMVYRWQNAPKYLRAVLINLSVVYCRNTKPDYIFSNLDPAYFDVADDFTYFYRSFDDLKFYADQREAIVDYQPMYHKIEERAAQYKSKLLRKSEFLTDVFFPGGKELPFLLGKYSIEEVDSWSRDACDNAMRLFKPIETVTALIEKKFDLDQI